MYGVGDDEKSVFHQARKEAYKLMSRDSFRRFVRDVVLPVVGEGVAFQCPPTLRVQFPSARALGP